MDDGIGAGEAGKRLETTVQTVRAMARDRTLVAAKVSGAWSIDPASLDHYLAIEGPLRGGRRHRSSEARQQAELDTLRRQLAEVTSAGEAAAMLSLLRERDELRERVAVLENAVARLRDVAELQRRAEHERSQLVEQLAGALGSAERSEQLRRKALEVLEDGLAGSLVPGSPPRTRS